MIDNGKITKLLTNREVCEIFQISRQTLFNWTKGGLIKAHRVARKIYYKPEEINEALKSVNDYQRITTMRRQND